MRKSITLVLIVVSVTFNLAFLAMWITHYVTARHVTEQESRESSQPCAIWSPLHQRLGVTVQQWKAIEPQFVRFQQASQNECREIQRLRLVLIDQLAAPTVNRHALDETQQSLQAHQQTQQRLIVEQLVAEKHVLIPSQQRELFQLIRQQTRCLTPGALLGDPAHSK